MVHRTLQPFWGEWREIFFPGCAAQCFLRCSKWQRRTESRRWSFSSEAAEARIFGVRGPSPFFYFSAREAIAKRKCECDMRHAAMRPCDHADHAGHATAGMQLAIMQHGEEWHPARRKRVDRHAGNEFGRRAPHVTCFFVSNASVRADHSSPCAC